MDQAYDLWWTETRKDHPWAIEATDDKLRRKAFRIVTLDEIRCSSARRVRKPRLAFQQT
jgi:hypothetical protein